MTVRRIASEADVAAGQVHYHFNSVGKLKVLTFVHLIRTLLMLGNEYGGFKPYITLWREAQILADRVP